MKISRKAKKKCKRLVNDPSGGSPSTSFKVNPHHLIEQVVLQGLIGKILQAE
jgi:hypothetical protein